MYPFWERWQGVSLPGDYLLQTWLDGDDAGGFIETAPAPDGRRAVVQLVLESATGDAGQLALWQRARGLRHPNLRALLDCGRVAMAGETARYAVYEYADDTLARALGRAPLSEAEAREVLDAVVAALGHLRANGLAVAALDPDHVVAVGEAIKLSTDALRQAAADDVPDNDDLRGFWNRISPSAPARSAEILAEVLGTELAPPAPRPFPKWILAAAAALVLLILALNLGRDPEASAVPPLPPPASAPTVPIAAPALPKPNPFADARANRAADRSPANQATWRVIVFICQTQDEAATKAAETNQQDPDLGAVVFVPQENNGTFLVALGGPLSREDALALQQKARAEHLGRGIYARRFPD